MKSGIEIRRSRRSLAVVAGMKKRMNAQNRQKSNAVKLFLNQNNYMHWQYKQCILKVQENMKFCVELGNRKDTIQKVLNDLYVL